MTSISEIADAITLPKIIPNFSWAIVDKLDTVEFKASDSGEIDAIWFSTSACTEVTKSGAAAANSLNWSITRGISRRNIKKRTKKDDFIWEKLNEDNSQEIWKIAHARESINFRSIFDRQWHDIYEKRNTLTGVLRK